MLSDPLCIQVSKQNRETLCSHQKRSPCSHMGQWEALRLRTWDTLDSWDRSKATYSTPELIRVLKDASLDPAFPPETKVIHISISVCTWEPPCCHWCPLLCTCWHPRTSKWVVCRRRRIIYNLENSQFTCHTYESTRNPRGREGGWRMQPSKSLINHCLQEWPAYMPHQPHLHPYWESRCHLSRSTRLQIFEYIHTVTSHLGIT